MSGQVSAGDEYTNTGNDTGTGMLDHAQSSLPFRPQPLLVGGQAGARGRMGDILSPGRLLTASVLTLGCSQGQHPSQRPNRIHIHERPLSLSNGLGTASACRM